METTRKTMKKPKTVVHKRIDYLGDGGTNDDATLTGDDKYRLYLDFTGSSEPIDVLFVIDTTSSMDSAMGSGDKTPRKTVVNNLMNGTVARSATDTGLVATSTLVRKVVQDDAHPEGTETVDKAAFVNSYQNEGPLTIVKSDSTDHGKRLSGATFSLYSDAECTADSLVTVYTDAEKTQEMTSFTTAGENGEITVYGLKPGTYYLKESAAPGGYCLIEGALAISVEKDKVTVQNVPGRIEADNNGGVLKVIVYDSPIYDIPSTGGRGTWMFHAAGLALMSLAAVMTIYRRRERGNGARA